MSSRELANIFDNAAGTISLRLKNVPHVKRILADFRQHVVSEKRNPARHPELVIEPPMLAQRLDVPRSAVEAVIAELHRFNFVHIWARATCPAVAEDDDNVIVETDDAKEFKSALRESCPHCGQYHTNLDWQNVETFYAVHLDDQPETFELRRFFVPTKRFSVSKHPPPRRPGFLEWVKRFFVKWARKPAQDKPVDSIAAQLALNQPTTRAPSNTDLAWKLAITLLAWSVLTAVAFVVLRYACDIVTALVVTSFMTLGGLIAAWVVLRSIFAASYLQRSIMAAGYAASIGLSVKSALDFKFAWGESIPLRIEASSHDLDNWTMFWAAVFFLGTQFFVVQSQAVQGWFSRQR